MIFTGFGAQSRANASSIIRRVRSAEPGKPQTKKLYLTFDDGPDADGTPAVLETLAKHQAKATFFVIAEKVKAQQALVARAQAEGHAIGNHSLNHTYGVFFSNSSELSTWIKQAEELLVQNGVREIVGFRPPAGVCTPPLFEALRQHKEPLVLWSHRFFDTTVTWSEKRMRDVLPQLRDGDILLLHDRQKPARLKEFIATLELFINESSRLGFQFEALSRKRCQAPLNKLHEEPDIRARNDEK